MQPFSAEVLRDKVEVQLRGLDTGEPATARAELDHPPDRALATPCAFDKYILLGKIGEGSYSIVYRARRRYDQLRVALKVLRHEVNEDRDTLARYFREIAILSNLEAPHVVRVVGSGYEQGR